MKKPEIARVVKVKFGHTGAALFLTVWIIAILASLALPILAAIWLMEHI